MFKLFLTMFLELFSSRVVESVWSKVVEWTADNAVDSARKIKDLELILKTLEENLELLSIKACDVEEEIKNAELSGRKKRKREVEEWLEQVKSIEKEVCELRSGVDSQGFMMRLMAGGEAAELNEQVEKLVEQSRNFGEFMLHECGTRGETLLTHGMIGEAFNKNSETIMKLLETKEVSRIGVYGMGGVGKTTLAKHVHNQLQQQSPGSVFWVTVSQEFNIKNLQDKIARFMGAGLLDDEDDEDIRAARLHRALSQHKHSVLILDDVWVKIDMMKLGYHVSDECCRLIITSRSLEVCRGIPCQKLISVEELREDEAWRLFSEKLGNVMELAPQVVEIAKSMAKLCSGLPLAIITTAGTMMGETSFYTWKHECRVLKERFVGQDDMGDNEEVYKVLRYSFDRLNRNHQSQSHEFNTYQLCFMYFSLYPEDHKMRRDHLVSKFISEGLLDVRNRREQVDLGHRILDKLVNASLLESCYDGPDKGVKMHDLVRGMALKINEGKYMVALDELNWTKGLEKVSLVNSGEKSIVDGISPDCPKLSTMLLFSYGLEVIPGSFFSKMQGLCTLDLCNTRITMLPDLINDLKSLKALLLENCRKLEYVPYLGKLKALRELNLSGTAIKKVPQGVEELINLKFLSLDADPLEMFLSGMLLKLLYLQHVNLPLHIPIEGIENLKRLEEFKGRVQNVSEFNCLIESGISQAHDSWYSITVGSVQASLPSSITQGPTYIDSFICEESSFGPTYNKRLAMCNYNLKDEMLLGQDIEDLVISECKGLSTCFVDDLLRFNNPTSLKKLTISDCGEMKCILRSEQGLPSQISSLVYIALENLDDLEEVFQKGEIGLSNAPTQAVFSSLTDLVIHSCNKMSKLGLPVSGFPNLEHLVIADCAEIKEIFEDEVRGSVTLPRLVSLSLCGLPTLEIVCKTAMICNSINRIKIIWCPRLMKKLPVHMDDLPPPSLGNIIVERIWWESLEWENPDLPQHLFDRGLLALREQWLPSFDV